jgi:TatA/E family protein of Tat protein translocase
MGNLGWTEILIILVIALIIFGPRKLPQLGKSLGESLAQFRRASEDFKRTWEDEVETEKRRLDAPPPDRNVVSQPEQEAREELKEPPATAAEEVAVTAPQQETVARETSRDWM